MTPQLREKQTTESFGSWVRGLRRRWALLLQAATAILGVVGTFVLPPAAAMSGATAWRRLAQFVAAVLIGLLFVAARRWRVRGRAPWGWLALGALLLAISSAFGYDYAARTWSCPYDGRQVIIGTEYTPQARAHLQRYAHLSCERLIADFAGQLGDVWMGEGIQKRHSALAGLYVGAVALFTISLVAIVEAVARAERTQRGGRTPRPRKTTVSTSGAGTRQDAARESRKGQAK